MTNIDLNILTFLCLSTRLPERLPVQSSSIQPVFSPQNFYESSKACCRIPEEEGHWSPYIPGRLSSLGCINGGSCEKYSATSNPPSVPRFNKKPHEIMIDSNTRLNVHAYDGITPGKKIDKIPDLSPSARLSKCHVAIPSKFKFTNKQINEMK